jgi:azurin
MSMRTLILATILVAASCSSEANKPAGGGTPAPAPAPAADVATFTIQGNDLMQYDVKQVEVKAGQKVRMTLKNIGTQPKTAMGHNLVVLRKGVTLEQFAPMCIAPKGTLENDYLPQDARKEVLAHTKILGPGESETIEFTAPGLPGELVYVCTFPGHFAVMNGKIIVK